MAAFNPSGSALYSTYVCGTDSVRGAGVSPINGNLIITGGISSGTLTTTLNALQPNSAGGISDAFVMELSPSGSLLYSSYLGGNGTDVGRGVAVDSLGNWYITGQTSSTDFPTTVNAIQAAYAGTVSNAFLTKINPNTMPISIVFSTYFGGNQTDVAHFIAVDTNAQAYLAGVTDSTNFPVFHALQRVWGGNNDGFWAVIATCDRSFSSPATFPASGSIGSISITTTPECGWTASSQAPWIVLTPSNPSGAGSGSVSYTVSANTGVPRSGTITISGKTIAFNQDGVSPATFSSSPPGASFTITGAGCAPGSYTTPATNLPWTPNTNCTISFPSPQTIGGFSYQFSSATVNGGASSVANPFNVNSGTSALSINVSLVASSPTGATHFLVTPSSTTATAGIPLTFTVTAQDGMGNTVTNYPDPVNFQSSDSQAALPADMILTNGVGTFQAVFVTPGVQTLSVNDPFNTSTIGSSGPITVSAAPGLSFIPITPCRVMDTRPGRPFTGPFGVPFLSGGTSRSIPIPTGACGGFAGALAYSVNVTVVPHSTLNFLTIWPTGQSQPRASTLNSDGRVKADAAIVAAGASGAVSVFATDDTDVIIDINGYFVSNTNPSGLAFYPMTPCRIMDTRVGKGFTGAFGPPSLSPPSPGATTGVSRTVPVQSSTNCSIPSTAQAYSLNFTVVPASTLGWLTAWPATSTEPGTSGTTNVSTLNAPTGTVVANAAIVPAGTDPARSISIFAHDTTDVIIDINGYFGPPGAGGLSYYPLTPCRVLDTRVIRGGTGPFTGEEDDNVLASVCGGTPAAQAYAFSATVVPAATPMRFITLWPQGDTLPKASNLNAYDGAITSNMAIVPTTNTTIASYASDPTDLILDLSGYFAP